VLELNRKKVRIARPDASELRAQRDTAGSFNPVALQPSNLCPHYLHSMCKNQTGSCRCLLSAMTP